MRYKALEDLTTTEKDLIVQRCLAVAGVAGENCATPASWDVVRAVEVIERVMTEHRPVRKGESYWLANRWTVADYDMMVPQLVRVETECLGSELTDADIGRKVCAENADGYKYGPGTLVHYSGMSKQPASGYGIRTTGQYPTRSISTTCKVTFL